VSLPKFLHGRLLPLEVEALVYTPGVGAHVESFASGSVHADLDRRVVPLLFHHDDGAPIGRVVRAFEADKALNIEAKLVGGPTQLEHVVAQVEDGLCSGLSIGAIVDPKYDVWTRDAATGLPRVTRGWVRMIEASICWAPAYDAARVRELSDDPGDRPALAAARSANADLRFVTLRRRVGKVAAVA
jgi:HK97 family phage prohead protease